MKCLIYVIMSISAACIVLAQVPRDVVRGQQGCVYT